MTGNDVHQRMIDKDKKPTDNDIFEYIGEKAKDAWLDLASYMQQNYEIEPETIFYGKNYGWVVRYRKSNKTLCSFFPEKNSFTFLITFGKNEVEKFLTIENDFAEEVVGIFHGTKQLHDGRWIYIRLKDGKLVQDIAKLITIKRKPKKK